MLVLSRKQDQAIRFPGLGISLHVCRISGQTVRLGIDAPRDVAVVRGELEATAADVASRQSTDRQPGNRLQAAQARLELARKQLACHQIGEAQSTLDDVAGALSDLDASKESSSSNAVLSNQQPGADAPRVDRESVEKPKRRALIVEDNDNERELLASYLRLSGFQVDTAANGLDAIKYLSQSDEMPQAVLLDMKMPKLNGAATITQIREKSETKDLKVFAVSGTSPAEMNVSVGNSGVDRWFAKPVNPEGLVRQLNAACEDQVSSESPGESDAETDELAPGYVWPLGVSFVLDEDDWS